MTEYKRNFLSLCLGKFPNRLEVVITIVIIGA